MAKTQQPLVWDFYRTVEGAENLGGVVHYHDEMSQSLWLSNGIQTNIANVKEGHWKAALVEEAVAIGTPSYSLLSLDHAYNGVLFGAAMLNNQLTYIRYVYSVDCSDIISSGQIGYSNNNSVVQIKANLMNIKEAIFMNDSTVFQPGAKVTFKILAGNETPMDVCTSYLDSVDYNIQSETVPISGRNNIGFKLMQSTFDEDITVEGKPGDVAKAIIELGGVKKYIVQNVDEQRIFEFRADQTLMSGLEQICNLYPGFKIDELPDGTVIIGYQNFVNFYQGNGYYVFDAGTVFKRKTKRSCDATYTKVRVTGKDAKGIDLKPVIVPVSTFKQWELPANKTFHEVAPDGYTQDELQTYAESLAEYLQFVGIGEDFTGPFRPQLSIGDVVSVDNGDGTSTTLGLVTSIKHNFGKSGYTTEFSTDSGGVLMETLAADENLITVTKSLNGYNRKQTLKDLIQVASGSSVAGPQSSGTVVKVISSSNAEMLGGKTYDEIVQAAVDAALKQMPEIPEIPEVPNELPPYTEADYGKVLMPSADGLVWTDVTFAEELPVAEEAEF